MYKINFNITELHQLEPKSCCQIFLIWITLFLTSLTPNICLAMGDIFSDAYLTVEYYEKVSIDISIQLKDFCFKIGMYLDRNIDKT